MNAQFSELLNIKHSFANHESYTLNVTSSAKTLHVRIFYMLLQKLVYIPYSYLHQFLIALH